MNIRGLVFRATFRIRSKTALLAILALLALGCAGRAHLIRDDLTAKDLEALVDSDSARGLLAMLRAVAVAIQLHRLPSEPAALVESTPRQRREIFIGEDGFNR